MSKIKKIQKFLASNKHQHLTNSENDFRTFCTFDIEVSKTPFEPNFSICVECLNIEEAIDILIKINSHSENINTEELLKNKIQERKLNPENSFFLTVLSNPINSDN